MRDCGRSTWRGSNSPTANGSVSQADSCGSHAARRRTRRVRAPRCAPLGAAGRERAARHRRHHWTPRGHWTRSAVAAAAGDRTTRGRGPKQQGDRRAAVPLTPNGRLAPVPDLPEARHYLACRAPGRACGLRRRHLVRTPSAANRDILLEAARRERRPANQSSDRIEVTPGRHRKVGVTHQRRPPMPTTTPHVVLVHGGFVDGSGWQGVYDRLTKDGHTVTVVQNPTISLEGDVATTK